MPSNMFRLLQMSEHQSMRDKICPCTNPAHEPESVNIVLFSIVIIITIVIVISNISIVFVGNALILELLLLLS